MTESSSSKSPDQLSQELISILAKLAELGLNSRIEAVKFGRVYFKLKKSSWKRRGCFAIGFLLAVFLGFAARSQFRSLRFEKCLIEQPSFARQLFRPAEDCSICKDVQQVEKISNVDPRDFEERYAYSGRPVVVTDAAANWTAMESFSFAFLRELYKDQEANCQFFPYKTEFRSLRDVFNMSTSRALMQAGSKPWYVGWSNCDEAIGSVLRKHYDRPYFLPVLAESEKTDWIFMGSPGYGAPMHLDEVDYTSWQAQIRGHKTWTLEPPRECHYVCRRLQVTVDPGEIIILDTNKWYHQTLIVSEDISITIGAEYD
ncbi:uncharacterized protein LOC100119666 [Nasonia vitripennis]|uniref:Cupin-like domain-containing protein n=1 Tax=Nasonia vitripennis TaxID=7425 RepID=A0A7M7H5P9_NASVI|nr:uncharacterized protein LOC100119666 [Nasonia vitripennis]